MRFWGEFEVQIHKAEASAVTKFSYLKELVELKVRKLIDELPFTDAVYEKAISLLQKRYGRPDEVLTLLFNVVNVNGLKFCALLDSGASHSYVSSKFVDLAMLSKLLWTLMSSGANSGMSQAHLAVHSSTDFERLCLFDVLGLPDTPAGDQSDVYSEFKEQLARSSEGWYETALSWKGNHPELSNNYERSILQAGSIQYVARLRSHHSRPVSRGNCRSCT